MHYINNLVKALAVCLIEAHKHNPTGSSGDKTGHLVAFFTASQKLMDVKSKRALGDASSFGLKISEIWNCNDIGVKDKTKIHDSNKKNFEKEVSSSKNKSIILPQELLEKIFNLLTQNDLFNISLTSKKFNNFVIPLLYKKPTITSPKNFCIFLNTIFTDDYNNANSSLWKYEYFVETIYFSPTNVGSFESIVATDSCISLDLNQVHSVLFRFLNFDRGIESYGGHPIFLMLVEKCKKLVSIREKNKDFFEGPAIKTSEGSWILTDYNLAQIMLATNRVYNMCRVFLLKNLPKINKNDSTANSIIKNLGSSYSKTDELAKTSIFLLEFLNFETGKVKNTNKFWDEIISSKNGILNFALLKSVVKEKVTSFLNAISSTQLYQVQYITGSAQRLLDAYCLLYYKALSMANNLQFEKILMKLKTIGNEIKGLDSLEFEEKCNRDLESSFELKIMQSLFIIVQTNPMVSGNTTEDDLNRNPLQSEKEEHRWIRCANCWENVSVDTLRESFIALTPGTINDETTEFLESLSVGFENMQYTDDLARNELIKCQKWIAEVISWQKANKQLTPVKENLKKSMKSMESWRSIQKRFNIRFLD